MMNRILRLLALLLAATALRATTEWTWLTPTENSLGQPVFGNGRFVAVAASTLTAQEGTFTAKGCLFTSEDGTSWTLREPSIADSFSRVIFDGTRFVAAAETTIATSPDGITWSSATGPGPVRGLAFSHGLYVALVSGPLASDPQQLFVSTDLAHWTAQSYPSIGSMYGVCSAGGTFIVSGKEGRILTSTDGAHWTEVSVRPNNSTFAAPAVATSDNRFLFAYGDTLLTSTNGLDWSYETDGPQLRSDGRIGFAGGFFWVSEGTGGRGIFRSTDGLTWAQPTPLITASIAVNTIAYGNGLWISGELQKFYSGISVVRAQPIYTSTDGVNWTLPSAPASGNNLVYGLGRFFFGGKSSPDGLTWADCGFEPTHAAGNLLFRITSVDQDGSVSTNPYIPSWNPITVEVSSDGLTSHVITPGLTPTAVAYNAGRYVMVGADGKIATSTDGDTWAPATSGTSHHLRGVIFAHNRFIAVGDGGTVLTSPDGLAWSIDSAAAAALADYNLQAVAAQDSHLVIAASPSSVYASDSIHSITLSAGLEASILVSSPYFPFGSVALTPFDSSFLCACFFSTRAGSLPSSQLLRSTDGASWARPDWNSRYAYTPADGEAALAVGNGIALYRALAGSSDFAKGVPDFTFAKLLRGVVANAPTSAPTVVASPVSTSCAQGETARFAVGLTGTAPFSYQWLRNGAPIAGATAPVLTLPLVADADAADYSVTVTNSGGSVTSAAATLTVTPFVPLTLTTEPADGTLYNGVDVTLHVAATGSGPITYQWRKNGVPISGATKSSLYLNGYTFSLAATAGDYDVVVTAPHSTVTSRVAHVANGGPIITLSSTGGTIPYGGSFTITASATGEAPFTYRWSRTIGGLDVTGPTLALTNLTPADNSPYRVEVTDVNGHVGQAYFMLSVSPSTVTAPVITAAPVSQKVAEDGSVTLSVAVDSPELYTYQWRKNGVAIDGATSATFTLSHFAAGDAADYDVVISAPGVTSVTTAAAKLTFGYAHLANLSVRAYAGTGEATLIQGFVLSGEPAGDVLVRSVGPGLLIYGLTSALADPSVKIITHTGTLVGTNDDWSTPLASGIGAPATTAIMGRLGASSLDAASRDSALVLRAIPSGLYMAQASGAGNTTGIVLNEIYADPTAPQRLVNLSARARVGTGDDLLIGGFVIAGNQPLKVLIRGVGPSLANQGISAPLTNPKITLYNAAGEPLHNNDNWSDAANLADLRAATATVGAFPLTDGSHDAALLETLAPGVYSVHVTAADASSGIALVEIYAVP